MSIAESSTRRTIRFDQRLGSYEGFFDFAWAQTFLGIAEKTKLEGPAFDLVRNWEGASYARSLPWIMIQCLDVATRAMVRGYRPVGSRLVQALIERLVRETGESFRPMARKKLQAAIEKIAADVHSKALEEPPFLDAENVWMEVLGIEDFHMAVWASERTFYGSLYFSYEWYIIACMKIRRGNLTYRAKNHKNLRRDFENDFGQSLGDICLKDQSIEVARLARHALVHNGGKVTRELSALPHGLAVEGDELQIMAPDTSALFLLLRDRVDQLTSIAVGLPEFQA